MDVAKKIRDLRYAKGWGPDELAAKAEISRTALYQIECGKTDTPRASTLRRIAQALEVPIEVFIDDTINLAQLREMPQPHSPPRSEIDSKFHLILESPLGFSLEIMVDEMYKLLQRQQRGHVGV